MVLKNDVYKKKKKKQKKELKNRELILIDPKRSKTQFSLIVKSI